MTPTIELHAEAATPLHIVPKPPRLDRTKWHKPLISIVVTHFNYSHHVRDALLSIVDQTYGNWECIVVDDCSTPHHRVKLAEILHEIGCDKIRLLCLDRNEGQIPAFFHGLDATKGEFACLLDPDDRYAETFLEEALAAHLNGTVFCPIVCTDQYLLAASGAVLSGTNRIGTCRPFLQRQGLGEIIEPHQDQLLYFPPWVRGWFFTSSSSMMIRRAALEYMRPARPLAYKGSYDSFFGQGAQMMGGSLFLSKPLVYRTIHGENVYLQARIFSGEQIKGRFDEAKLGQSRLADVIEAIRHNGGGETLDLHEERRKKPSRRTFATRLRRSINKRVNWIARQLARGSIG